jgi:hypothetical protein
MALAQWYEYERLRDQRSIRLGRILPFLVLSVSLEQVSLDDVPL